MMIVECSTHLYGECLTNSYYLLDRMHIGQLEGDNYIWMASYADSTSYPRSHDMWQYTDNGRVPGITTWDGRAASVDMNVWYE